MRGTAGSLHELVLLGTSVPNLLRDHRSTGRPPKEMIDSSPVWLVEVANKRRDKCGKPVDRKTTTCYRNIGAFPALAQWLRHIRPRTVVTATGRLNWGVPQLKKRFEARVGEMSYGSLDPGTLDDQWTTEIPLSCEKHLEPESPAQRRLEMLSWMSRQPDTVGDPLIGCLSSVAICIRYYSSAQQAPFLKSRIPYHTSKPSTKADNFIHGWRVVVPHLTDLQHALSRTLSSLRTIRSQSTCTAFACRIYWTPGSLFLTPTDRSRLSVRGYSALALRPNCASPSNLYETTT